MREATGHCGGEEEWITLQTRRLKGAKAAGMPGDNSTHSKENCATASQRVGIKDDSRAFQPVYSGNSYHRDVILLGTVPPQTRVLDVECADGRLGCILESKSCRVTGIESSPHLAALASDSLSAVTECGSLR